MARLQQFQRPQAGVFSTADLESLLGDAHPAGFVRRVQALEREKALTRFVRGWYVTPTSFDAFVLSQRVAPRSYISLGTALARYLVVGVNPKNHVWAVKLGPSRVYEGAGCRIVHLGIQERDYFGFEQGSPVRWATPEKALLDTLYFYLRGRRFAFDVYSDLNLGPIDRSKLMEHLQRYRNPKFHAFVKAILRGNA